MNNSDRKNQGEIGQEEHNSASSKHQNVPPNGRTNTGTATRQSVDTTASDAEKETGDPGRTPGKAEGVESFRETGNE